ncbi:receptor-type tyrosine-protein phosphatase epsilon-like isoform X2 [Argopecten irradians]|uniref:receptor-type tyrosine-protein phosphatase epsilon-like isoform X2 n=1 Tax=Argopecten irradians TaxID=31199 RepID=UPI0037174597
MVFGKKWLGRVVIFILFSSFQTLKSKSNLARWKQASQSSNANDKWVASKAIDGCRDTHITDDCCTHTLGGGPKTAWWRVDLGEPMTINSITIYYRAGYGARLAGYHLYVSNTTDIPPDHVLCYEDKSSTNASVQLIITHQCPYVGRYVTVYNYRNNPKRYSWYDDYAVLELCEVQVWGCQVGRYGDGNCQSECSIDCYGGNCNATTGDCFYCVPKRYGARCGNDCSPNCVNQLCYSADGNCHDCVPKKYGAQCEHNCSLNCLNQLCERTVGKCQECIPTKYGDRCDTDCSINCMNKLCVRGSGDCYDCIAGKHGIKCNHNCPGNCKDMRCEQNTGACLGCENGYFGTNCSLECIDGCSKCIQHSGECTECQSGLYGGICNLTCGHCSTCQMDSGVCLTTCDSGFEGDLCRTEQVQMPENQTPSVDAGPIAGAVVGVIALAVVGIVIVILIRRRRLDPGKQENFSNLRGNRGSVYSKPMEDRYHNSEIEESNVYSTILGQEEPPEAGASVYVNAGLVTERTGADDDDYYNASDPVGIPISELKSDVERKLQNKAKAFEDEYKSIPSGALHDHKIGMMDKNKAKNRFKTTFPYDHSRVVLETVENNPKSDYINANYIDSVTQPTKYVATQGPRPGTVNDFWRMIWQLNTGKIIMLTNLIEGGRPKCDKYWPDEGEPLDTSIYNIILDRERSYAFYVIRDLKVTNKKTKAVRQIHQFHYITWPDHGTPDPNELVVFHRRVKNYEAALKGKMVVHCSAGIGRTGTFLALDALLEYGKETGNVDVLQYVKTMRKDRVNMVQTAEQYIAVHQLLIEAFEMPDTLISRMNFPEKLRALTNDGPANQTKLRKEYQLTQSAKPNYDETEYRAALLSPNKMKNRTLSVLAADRFRAYLRSQQSSRTDYINAVMVPSYTSKTGYFVTQTPLEDTVVDLLTMIIDHNCQTLVIIETDPIKWLPDENSENKRIGEFRLEHKKASSTIPNVDVHDIGIESVEKSFTTTVRMFHMTGWDRDSPVPKDSPVLLQLLEVVDSRRRSDDTKTTVVMCRDGYSQSGLFCCISNARDQMKCDEEVDIFQISRQLLVRRPEFITNFEQYQCCYSMIKDYIDTTNVYVN